MFARVALALLVAAAPMKAAAGDLPDADAASVLHRRATKAAKRAKAASDPAQAALAAFRAKNFWEQAHQVDGDERHLCAARSLLRDVCARNDLEPIPRASLERSRDALAKIKCAPDGARSTSRRRRSATTDTSKSLTGRSAKIATSEVAPEGESESPHLPSVPVTKDSTPEAPPFHIDLLTTEEVDAKVPTTASPSTGTTPVERARPERPLRSDQDLSPRRRLPLQVSGGVSLVLGLVALSIMTPFAIRDAALADEIRRIAATKEATGGLTPAQAERFDAAVAESPAAFRSALAWGLSGGIATTLGIGLLIASRRRSSASGSLALRPRLDLNSASMTLQGRF